jgi:type VI secretion system VasI family protein
VKQISFVAYFLLSSTTLALAQQGQWLNRTDKSALTDKTSVYWQLEAENEVPNSIGRPEKPRMQVMCIENETRLVFDLNDYMGSDDLTMAYRIDSGAVKKKTAGVSVKGNVFGFWNGTGVGLLKELQGKSKLVISAPPYSSGPKEGIFDLTGVDLMLANVRKTCGW